MRMNNLSGTMLHIGERLLISHPEFSIVIQRKAKLIVLLDHGAFFKQYHIREEKLPAKQPPQDHDQSRGNHGLARWQTGRLRHARNLSAARAGFGWPLRLTRFIPCPIGPSDLDAAAALRAWVAATDVEELSSLVNNQTPVTITD